MSLSFIPTADNEGASRRFGRWCIQETLEQKADLYAKKTDAEIDKELKSRELLEIHYEDKKQNLHLSAWVSL